MNCFTCNAGTWRGGIVSQPKPVPALRGGAEALAGLADERWWGLSPGKHPAPLDVCVCSCAPNRCHAIKKRNKTTTTQ